MEYSRASTALICITLCLLFVPGATIAAPGDAPASAPSKRPNIVFLMGDQWRAQAFGYAGDPNVKTPNIDRLAAESVNFTHAVAGMPVCSPTRASLLTGQRPIQHGIFVNDAHLADDAATFAEVLRDGGYDTAMIGKWHLEGHGREAFIPREHRQGFDYWKVLECTHAYNKSIYYADGPEKLQWEGYDAIAQTKDAGQYIKDHAKVDKPFLLCLWWGPPHNPYSTAPKRFAEMYDADKIQLRPNVSPADAATARKELAGYYAHCSALDECVGDLRQTLREAGIDRDTIIVFTSDHGDMIHSNGFERKQKPWDESVRVPMLWHYPKGLGETGKQVDAPISSEDVMPTLLRLTGAEVPKTSSGFDYSGYMRGGPNPNPSNAALISCLSPFGEFIRKNGGREYRGIRTPRYTYVRDLNGPWLLYDNETDPYQQHNLVGPPAAAELQAKLEPILAEKLKEANDKFEPGDVYLAKWGYKDRVNANGTLPTTP